MDGLECSVLSLQQVQNADLRFDSEYYSKANLSLSEILNNIGKKTISEYGGLLDCSAFYPSITGYYSNNRENIPFLRVNEISNGLIVITDNTVFLPHHVVENNSKTIALAYPGDIIIAKGGNTLAKVGLVTDEYPMYATCRDVIILRTNELNGLNNYYLWAFLHSKYGQGILWRSASQTGQPHLTLPAIMKIKVPDTKFLQSIMERLYKESVDLKEKVEACYHEAERNILSNLNIQIQDQTTPVIAEKSFTESFLKSGRLDAEYYQPKYDRLFDLISAFNTTVIPSEYNVFKNTGNDYTEGISEVGVIKTKQLSDSGVDIDGVESYFDLATCIENKSTFLKNGDVVFASMGVGSLGKVSLFLSDDEKQYVTDSTLRIYRAKPRARVLPEVLCIYLQSTIGQELIYRYVVGSTGIISIYDADMAKILIPILDGKVQKKIATKVQESFALRRKSKELLEYAKQAVEMAIEQGEDAALEWLKDKVGV